MSIGATSEIAEPSTTDNSTHLPRTFDSMSGELSNQINQASQQSKYSTRKAPLTELESRKSHIKTIRNQVGSEQRTIMPKIPQASKTTQDSKIMRNVSYRNSKDR
jgi:hypothetical protein